MNKHLEEYLKIKKTIDQEKEIEKKKKTLPSLPIFHLPKFHFEIKNKAFYLKWLLLTALIIIFIFLIFTIFNAFYHYYLNWQAQKTLNTIKEKYGEIEENIWNPNVRNDYDLGKYVLLPEVYNQGVVVEEILKK